MVVSGTALGAACPNAAGDNGRNDIPSHVGFTSSCTLKNESNTRYIILDNEYFPDGRRFTIMFPDEANMPGDVNPVKFVFSPTSYSSLSTINVITCVGAPGAVITGVDTTLGTVTLDDGTSCTLTISSAVGGNTFIYTSTLFRTGAVYSSINADFSILDTTAPGVHSISRQSPSLSPTNADTLTWRVIFDENVQNVDATDFTRTGTTATISVSTISLTSYNISLSGGDLANLNATVTLGFAGSQDIQDIAGNPLTNTIPAGQNSNFFVVDNSDSIPPTIEIQDAPVSVADNSPFGVTFEFSEDVINFAQGSITVANGTASGFAAQDGNTYTADITPDGNGDITIDVAASVAQDGAGNDNTAAPQVTVLFGHILLPPAKGVAGPGEDINITFSATRADGVTPVSATLSLTVSHSKLPGTPDSVTSMVSAIDISSTSSVSGYILAVTLEIEASSNNQFTGFWKYGAEASGGEPDWYDYGTLAANGDGTGYEISTDQKSLTIYLKDGVRGDNDWEVNASITDPALPIIQAPQTVFEDGFESTE